MVHLFKGGAVSLGARLLAAFHCDRHWLGVQAILPDGTLSALSCQAVPSGRERSEAFWLAAIERHLAGRERLSVYLAVTQGARLGRCRLGVVDFDGAEDRYADAIRLMDALAKKEIGSHLARSWTDGHFHVWVPFRQWLPAGKVHRFLSRLLTSFKVVAEVRPSGMLSGDGPKQQAIALPFFDTSSSSAATGRCQIIEPDTQAPIPMEHFLNHAEWNGPPPELPPDRREAALAWRPGQSLTVDGLVNSWPPVGKREGHVAPNGRFKAGRDDAAVGHAGELVARGIVGAEALALLEHWDSRNTPPLGRGVLAAKVRQAEQYRTTKARGGNHALQ